MTDLTPPRDHGGNLDSAMARFGGQRADWLDLSTGINPTPYPLPAITDEAWAALPRKSEMAALCDAARKAYRTKATVVPFSGAQHAIQTIPWLRQAGRAKVLTPTYNEHAATLRTGGWQVEEVTTFHALRGADCAVVVNPNNPDGQSYAPDRLKALARDVGSLVVDESFADPLPDVSLAPALDTGPANIVVLRSFGKFYGLAGMRLGFALARAETASRLSDLAGPWPVSGPAIEIARQALADTDWQNQTTNRLRVDAERLDALATSVGWHLVGGTPLFRTYHTQNAAQVQDSLARQHVWSRIFPYSDNWLRLGLPSQDRWSQVEKAITHADQTR